MLCRDSHFVPKTKYFIYIGNKNKSTNTMPHANRPKTEVCDHFYSIIQASDFDVEVFKESVSVEKDKSVVRLRVGDFKDETEANDFLDEVKTTSTDSFKFNLIQKKTEIDHNRVCCLFMFKYDAIKKNVSRTRDRKHQPIVQAMPTQKDSVAWTFLRYAFFAVCVLFVVLWILSMLEPDEPVRVKKRNK